jgi:hypothetical protein
LKTKICFSSLKNALAYYSAGVVVVNSRVIGLGPAMGVMIKKSTIPYPG